MVFDWNSVWFTEFVFFTKTVYTFTCFNSTVLFLQDLTFGFDLAWLNCKCTKCQINCEVLLWLCDLDKCFFCWNRSESETFLNFFLTQICNLVSTFFVSRNNEPLPQLNLTRLLYSEEHLISFIVLKLKHWHRLEINHMLIAYKALFDR